MGLYVDGYDVQYWKRIDLSNNSILPSDRNSPVSSSFWGFKRDSTEIRSFVFSEPAVSDLPQHSQEMPLGTIKVVIYEAKVVEGYFHNNCKVKTQPPNVQSVSEGKKFWKQASVTTVAGEKVENEKEKFIALERWENVNTEPIKILQTYYHNTSMISFLRNQTNSSLSIQSDSFSSLGEKRASERSITTKTNKSQKVDVIDLLLDDEGDDSQNNEKVPVDFKRNNSDLKIKNVEFIDSDLSIITVEKKIDVTDMTDI
jgi:hypothetical protein